jgi:MerR family transcriptional regulator, light-induced transcriptional regulator
MSDPPDLAMSLADAASELGVHYQTAYGWVRQGVLPARKTGRSYAVRQADVRTLGALRASGLPPRRELRVRDWSRQADILYAAIVSGSENAARARLDRLVGGVPVVDICQRVIGPAMRRIGDEWAAGMLTVAVEHRATAICEQLIAARVGQQPRGRPRGVAVTATPPGERHALPALMAAACLREDRWLVHHLASDLPAADLASLASEVGASLVVLSSATAEAASRAQREASQLIRAELNLRVLTGRPGDTLNDLLRLARGAAE